MHLSPRWLRLLFVLRLWLFDVDFLFIVTPIVGVCNCSMFCCTLLYVHSSIAIILMGRRELVALLNLSSWCLVMVERLFLAVLWGCLLFVIFPDHTHLLLFTVLMTTHYQPARVRYERERERESISPIDCIYNNYMHHETTCLTVNTRAYSSESALNEL